MFGKKLLLAPAQSKIKRQQQLYDRIVKLYDYTQTGQKVPPLKHH